MSFHLSLSSTSSSSLTRFRPVVMPYNDKLALFKSFSILSIHRCLGVKQVVFLLASNYELWMATSLCSFWRYVFTISFSFSGECSLLFPALSLLAPPHCLLYPYALSVILCTYYLVLSVDLTMIYSTNTYSVV